MATYIKRKNGYLVQIRCKGHDSISRTFDTKAEGERWATSIESKIGSGEYTDTREAMNTTLKECLERYQREITVSKKGADQENYRIALWLRDPISDKPVGAIRSTDIASGSSKYFLFLLIV